jgi:5-methylthioadenosine/S-adenosylhomocysteine deaminase
VHNHESSWVRASEALAMATQGGAAALGHRGELGTLEPGMLADVVLVDRLDLGLVGAVDVEAALAHSETGRGVRHVAVGGRLVLEDGRPTLVDDRAVREAIAEQRGRRQAGHDAPPAATLAAMRKLEALRAAVIGV